MAITPLIWPIHLGVDEAGTAAIITALRLGAAAGVGLALVRKARGMVGTAPGLGLFFVSRWRDPPGSPPITPLAD